MIVEAKVLTYYQTINGREPFRDWQRSLEKTTSIVVDSRLARIRHGLIGDAKSVGHGVFELRIHFGPGYRIYFAQFGRNVVLLLCGGDKQSQRRDIEHAKAFWDEFRRRNP